MTTLMIEPVEMKSLGGYDVKLTGITLGSFDAIRGTITTPSGERAVSWDVNGICRDATEECNLNPRDAEFMEIVEDVKQYFPD
jgi:hypothetical protein